jgi:hypothetical protein
MDHAMTSDRSAKQAARVRMATTGEAYSTARRAVQTGPDRPAPLARPPAIDPREHAVHARHWGELACYLVRYEGRYTHTVDGHRFDLVSYLDTAGGRCVAIDRDGRPHASESNIRIDEQRLASTAVTWGYGTTAIYGRVHDSVTELYAVMKNGERVDWPIYDDPRNAERYYAVVAASEALDDIVAVAPSGSRSFGALLRPVFQTITRPRRSRARDR